MMRLAPGHRASQPQATAACSAHQLSRLSAWPPCSRRSTVRRSNDPAASQSTSTAATDIKDGKPAAPQLPPQQASPTASMGSMDGTQQRRVRKAESTDAVASFLSRRFGLAGGLAWLGFLTVGTLGEQVKTRMEVAAEKAGTKDVSDSKVVTLPSGVTYQDQRIGGGQQPIKGYLIVLDYIGRADGVEFDNTKARGKPIVFLYGSRPFTGGVCAGVEQALAGMKAGGKRRVTVPAELGFGEKGAVLRPTEHVPGKQGIVPPGAQLEYELELVRVSIPPS